MSGIDTMVVRQIEGRTELALLSGTRLIEVRFGGQQHSDERGSIHMGRVERLAGDVEAAFVDFGAERAGFLRFTDMIGGVGERPQAGDPVLVQVVRPAGNEKGARLTTKLSIPGRHLRLRPQEAGLSFDERIEDRLERERLAQALGPLAQDIGITLAPGAAGRDGDLLRIEIERLMAGWDRVRAQALTAKPPTCLFRDGEVLAAAVRDFGLDLRRIIVPDRLTAKRVETAIAAHGDSIAVELHRGEPAIFEICDIEAQIDQALAPKVALPSGGELLFELGRTLSAIDVDSGSAGAAGGATPRRLLSVNLEAAEEIARQLRLRNIGGIVIVDFAAMRESADRDRALGRLAIALAEDPTPCHLVGPTRLGLIELTRARRGPTLAQSYAAAKDRAET